MTELCPLLAIAEWRCKICEADCKHEGCAWYCGDTKACAVWALVSNLSDLVGRLRRSAKAARNMKPDSFTCAKNSDNNCTCPHFAETKEPNFQCLEYEPFFPVADGSLRNLEGIKDLSRRMKQ